MNSFTSFYLNVSRVIAAICVFVSHCTFSYFSEDTLNYSFLHTGHNMVIIFFVISGFVIAYSADQKEKTIDIYIIDRISRLYSVIIPALLFTFCIDLVGNYYQHEHYKSFVTNDSTYYLRFVIAFFNLQQNWWFSSTVSSNGPFWSVAYEFWYYILFGLLFVMKGNKRYLYALAITILIGPKILLLLPCWAMGVLVYYLSKKITSENAVLNYAIFSISLIILLIYLFNIAPLPFKTFGEFGYAPLFFSADFINDLLLAVLFSLNVWVVTQIKTVSIHKAVTSVAKYLADGTFTLYLFHLPLIIFVSWLVSYDKNNLYQLIALMVGMISILIVMGNYIEVSRFTLRSFLLKHLNKKETIKSV